MAEPPYRVSCTSLEQQRSECFLLSRLDSGVRIDTPSVFTRMRVTRQQTIQLRDALNGLLDTSAGGERR